MKTSTNGRAFLTKEEGKRNKAYKDSVGVWTIGVGHTASAGAPVPKSGLVLSDKEVDEVLEKDLQTFEKAVMRYVTVGLSQNEFDALVSLCFNIGEANFKKSSVVRLLNEGKRKEAAEAFLLWKKAGNDPDLLLPRRKRERELFLSTLPVESNTQAPTQTQEKKGLVSWVLSLLFRSSENSST